MGNDFGGEVHWPFQGLVADHGSGALIEINVQGRTTAVRGQRILPSFPYGAKIMIMTILKAPELAYFVVIAASFGLLITLTAVRFAPIHRRAITDRRQSHTAAAVAVAPTTAGYDASSCRARSTR